MSEVIVTSLTNLQNEVQYGTNHTLITDEPVEAGGDDAGPDPYTLLLAALGTCTSMTVMLYARRRAWAVKRVTVRLSQRRIHAKDCQTCGEDEEGYIHHIERAVTFEGELTTEQIDRLREIAQKCPIHKTLSSKILIADLNGNADQST